MGSSRSPLFQAYRKLCVRTFLALRRHRGDLLVLVEMMLEGNADLPCFIGGRDAVVDGLTQRFMPGIPKRVVVKRVHSLIDRSLGSWRTTFYDKYQRWFQGIKD
jgi:phosphatidylinositol 4-kinase